MKYKILSMLLLACIIMEQLTYCSQQSSPEHVAYRLTQESYITPEMQWAVLSLYDAQSMTINTKTGTVQGIESVDVMLKDIDKKLLSPLNFATKEIMRNALHAMLEATDIAIFVAAIEAAYSNQIYLLYQEVDSQLSTLLNEQKNRIHHAISRVNGITAYDQPATGVSSYFSWFTSSTPTNVSSYVAPLIFNDKPDGDEFITIPAPLVQEIIKKNDYKLEAHPQHAAQLLFKECFIAQQHHLKDRVDKLTIKLHSPLLAHNYIFAHFHSIHEACEIAKKIVPAHHKRHELHTPVTLEQRTAHKLLLDIRQAIQTALYIANARSSYNVGYILPASVTAYLNSVVNELLQYDAQLDVLCKSPEYGATQDDIYRDEQWAMITKLAAGTLAAAAIGTGIYFFAPVTAIGSLITGSAGTAAKGVATLTTAQKIWNAGQTVKGYTDAIGQAGATVAAAGGTAAFATKLIKDVDKSGMAGISLEDIDAGIQDLTGLDVNTRYAVDVAQKVGTGAAVIGGAGVAIGGAGNAIATLATAADAAANSKSILWSNDYVIDPRTGKPVLDAKGNKIYNSNSALYNIHSTIKSSTSALNSGKNAFNSTQNAIAVGAGALSVASQIIDANNSGLQQNNAHVPAGHIPPQKLAEAFVTFIKNDKPVDALGKIDIASQKLLQEHKTNPAALRQALQETQRTIQENNLITPEISHGLNYITQKITKLMQQ